jgi:hypothetical protein
MIIPPPQNTLIARIDRAHEEQQEPPRPHMGASQLGHHCDRWLWLSFRWAVMPKFPGRILRLFRRGQNEEATIVADLKAAGVDIRANGNEQQRISFGCHIGGSVDGIIESGVPEAPNKRHIAEFKTHSKKSFDEVEAKGVQESKPMHYVQMQLYMHGTEIDRALYVAVCKDDDRLYIERVRYDAEVAVWALNRGRRIVTSPRMPEPCQGASPSWYQCKFCDGFDICHGSNQIKPDAVNCRTCAHSTALESGVWHCALHDMQIPTDASRKAYPCHVLHPDLVPWKMNPDKSTDSTACYEIDGRDVMNGTDGKASVEVLSG